MVSGSGATMTANGLWVQIVVQATLPDGVTFLSENYPDGTVVPAGQSFTKTWTVLSSGSSPWNSNYPLQYVSSTSTSYCSHSTVAVSGSVAPGSNYTFSIGCTAPSTGGT